MSVYLTLSVSVSSLSVSVCLSLIFYYPYLCTFSSDLFDLELQTTGGMIYEEACGPSALFEVDRRDLLVTSELDRFTLILNVAAKLLQGL